MEIRDWSKRAVKTSAPRDLTESGQVATLRSGGAKTAFVQQPPRCRAAVLVFVCRRFVLAFMSSHDERSPQQFLHCGQFLSAGDRASIVETWRAAARELDKHDL